jgi:signal transduction histidine kinase
VCRIELAVARGRALLSVEDDGVGLAARESTNGSGLGLAGMGQRADELGGTLSFGPAGDGRPGSAVTVTIPTSLAP